MSNDTLRKAVFLDRDGVLNVKRDDYVKSEKELLILPNIHNDLSRLNKNGFELFIITNQSAINRGIISNEDVSKINKRLLNYLSEHDVKISKIYVCPHRPDEHCSCRKPNTGMIEQAVREFQIDLKSSWFIGDSDSDMEAANRVGCKFIRINTMVNLTQAVNSILQNS